MRAISCERNENGRLPEAFKEHLDDKDWPLVFAHACMMRLEGIVLKRRDSFYRSGCSPDWVKSKNRLRR
jgi:ATP-dependent DNA ligase